MTETILVMNAGSSSIKFQLFTVTARDKLQRRLKGQIEGIGLRSRFVVTGSDGKKLIEEAWPASEADTLPAALDKVVAFLRAQPGGALPAAIGHRVVHGGPKYAEPTPVDDAVLEDLQRLSPLAPLHQPNNLAPIRAVRQRHPQLLQVACFDTAFHRTHPEIADRYAVPEWLHQDGVRRYGFHGLSYEYVSGRLREIAPQVSEGRVVAAFLAMDAAKLITGETLYIDGGYHIID